MSETAIEQAVFVREGNGSGQFRSRSPGFREEWCPDTQRLCDGFGSPSAGMECPTSVFAHRLTRDQVAVVQVCDLGTGGTKSPGSTGFRLLIIPRLFYEEWIGDPFVVADRFPPRWQDKDPLLALSRPFERLPIGKSKRSSDFCVRRMILRATASRNPRRCWEGPRRWWTAAG